MEVAGLIGGGIVVLASVIGSAIGLAFKKISHKVNDILLGFAAGVMLAAAFISLLPQVFQSTDIWNIILGVLGVAIGALSISVIDKFVPHTHFDGEKMRNSETESKKGSKVMLLIIAIAIHNIPEGLATGLALNNGLTQSGLTFLISMIIQKVPEGLIIVIPLVTLGMKKSKIILYALVVAFMMIPGVLIGVLFGFLPQLLITFFTAFAFGAIIYVISDEVIPESHQHGHEKSATYSLLIGIICVTLISVLLPN